MNDVENRVKKILKDILGIEIYEDISMKNCDKWNSLAHINIIMGVEEEFEISFMESSLPDLTSFKAIVSKVEEMLRC